MRAVLFCRSSMIKPSNTSASWADFLNFVNLMPSPTTLPSLLRRILRKGKLRWELLYDVGLPPAPLSHALTAYDVSIINPLPSHLFAEVADEWRRQNISPRESTCAVGSGRMPLFVSRLMLSEPGHIKA